MQKVATFHRAEGTAVVTRAHIRVRSVMGVVQRRLEPKKGLTVAVWPVQLLAGCQDPTPRPTDVWIGSFVPRLGSSPPALSVSGC